jgi:hypothetical protein
MAAVLPATDADNSIRSTIRNGVLSETATGAADDTEVAGELVTATDDGALATAGDLGCEQDVRPNTPHAQRTERT